jgi:Right handed beta helix region/Bacterial Ig domain
MRRLALTTAIFASLFAAGNAAAATFYVSANGSDASAGTSASAPWKSVSKVNATALSPGDAVLFEGGSTFSGLLQPQGSGGSSAPITFGSYGTGRATLAGGIQLQSQSWLVFTELRVDTGAWATAGSTRGIRTADEGSGVQNVVVRDCAFVNVAIGLLFSNHLDRYWTVSNNVIQYTRDSGILIFDPTVASEIGGSDMTFAGNQILDTGLDTSLSYKKHGVYDIGTNLTWRNNVIRNFSDGGFSLRARGNTLIGNTISGGPYAIYYSPYDSTPGTTTIAYNKISNVTGDAIELASSGNVANVESFSIMSNSIASNGSAPGIRIIGTTGSVTLANNLVQTVAGPLLRVDTLPGRGLVEHNNLWWSVTPAWNYLGASLSTLSGYQAASARGTADRSVPPQVDAGFVPLAGSPIIDAGTTTPGSYIGDCTGTTFHYCGAAPDLGAVETSAPAPFPPPPISPPAQLQPPSGLIASVATASSLTLAWTASPDSRVVRYQLLENGVPLSTTSLTTLAVNGLTCGTSYSFSVTGLDSGGKASTAAGTNATTAACIDTTPPVLTITYPANGQIVALTFVPTANATDGGSGIKNVTFWFDGSAPCVDSTAPYVSCPITTTRGGHTLRVRATDTAGNYVEQIIRVWAARGVRNLLSASATKLSARHAQARHRAATIRHRAAAAAKRREHAAACRAHRRPWRECR